MLDNFVHRIVDSFFFFFWFYNLLLILKAITYIPGAEFLPVLRCFFIFFVIISFAFFPLFYLQCLYCQVSNLQQTQGIPLHCGVLSELSFYSLFLIVAFCKAFLSLFIMMSFLYSASPFGIV